MKKRLLWILFVGLSFCLKAQDFTERLNSESNTQKSVFGLTSNLNTNFVCADPCCLGASDIRSTTVRLGWGVSEQNALSEVQYKPVTGSTWTTVTNIIDRYINLESLMPNTTYQWKVKTICDGNVSSNFVTGNNFTTECPAPCCLGVGDIRSTSVKLTWGVFEQNALSEVQYKPVAGSTWTTITNILERELILNGLSPNTVYQFKVRVLCPTGNPSNFVTGNNFTTECPAPCCLGVGDIRSTSVKLTWGVFEQNALSEVQYKPVAGSTWTTITNILERELILNGLSPNTVYQFKVRVLCPTGNPSNFVTGNNFTTECPAPCCLGVGDIRSTSVKLTWGVFEQNALSEVQYKPVAGSTWTTITNILERELILNGLSPNTVYQFKVRVLCPTGNPSNFVIGNNFTTLCTAPTGLGNGNVTLTSADLIWLSVSGGISYEVRYRVQGSNTAWTTQTVNAPTVTPNSTVIYGITGLSPQTSYEWQVRTICAPLNTAFSTLATFMTSCPLPTSLNTTDITTNSAKLNWTLGLPGATYDLQWRLVGANTWTTVAGIATNFYTLTGLSVGGNYQWQVRSNCSPTVSSAYATPISFTASCPLPTNLSVANLLPGSVQLNWSGGYAGGTYSVQWRQQGTSTWTTINNISSLPYTLTGLTAGTIYEWQVKLLCTPSVTTIYAGPSTFTTPTTCASMYTIKNGSWNDATVWSCNRIPNTTDVVLIKHIITVPTGYTAQAQQITYDQGPTVKFQQTAQLNFLH
ncbi:fibronectin type III domain-containing protein [Emticicia sp. SJ17W-69]|uniref:fibronectin type III domain-containing protein n=1 Tax=Emticicia sp. SJ17W-69 TaxID=3421657 RepID=UPI003EB8C676